MIDTVFDYHTFIRLSGRELVHYMEPILSSAKLTIADDVADRILTDLPTYDEYHLVYGILVGFRRIPERVVPLLPIFLGSVHDSVYCTTLNILNDLPAESLTDKLIQLLHNVRDAHPERPYLSENIAQLEQKHRKQ